jgi:hypothetical protein
MIQRIVIEDQSGESIQVVEYLIENPMSAPRPDLAIYGWSNDSTKLYFYNSFGFDGGGQPNLWNGYHLQSIEVETGEVNEILPADDLAAFALSPDQTQLAYALDSDLPRKIHVRDLDSGYEISALVLVPIREGPGSKYTQIGKLTWSPSGKFILVHGFGASQYLYLFDIEKSWVILLFEYWEFEFDPWLNEDLIRYITYNDEVFEYNLMTGETTLLGTATPEP